jgi:hypothetical protein
MLVFTMQPLVGVGPINFGMTRSEVRGTLANLGQPKAVLRSPNTDCFFQNAFQVSYDDDGRVEFIETAASSEFRVILHGHSLHEIPATDAIRLVSQFAECDRNDPEKGYSYIFPALQLSLWRPVLPSDPDDSEGRHFLAVGLGKAGYFSSSSGSGSAASEGP